VVDSAQQHGAGQTIRVKAARKDGSRLEFDAVVRIDTPNEFQYYRHGGILHYVLRQLIK
jgi:aconitate hydratase